MKNSPAFERDQALARTIVTMIDTLKLLPAKARKTRAAWQRSIRGLQAIQQSLRKWGPV